MLSHFLPPSTYLIDVLMHSSFSVNKLDYVCKPFCVDDYKNSLCECSDCNEHCCSGFYFQLNDHHYIPIRICVMNTFNISSIPKPNIILNIKDQKETAFCTRYYICKYIIYARFSILCTALLKGLFPPYCIYLYNNIYTSIHYYGTPIIIKAKTTCI